MAERATGETGNCRAFHPITIAEGIRSIRAGLIVGITEEERARA
jgi:hypothetical protein